MAPVHPATTAPPVVVDVPATVSIPAIDVTAPLVALHRDPATGVLVPPEDFDTAGWYADGPEPGEPGPSVIAGHVDDYTGPAVFFRLRDLAPGDQVTVSGDDGTSLTYVVQRVERHPKDAFPTVSVYGPTEDSELRLVTCGGDFDRDSGHYRDNVVVFATLTG
ncbi:MAG TPA: class F sortase [Acidimicrobiales bacterium]